MSTLIDVRTMRTDKIIITIVIVIAISSIACLLLVLQSLPRYIHRQADHLASIHYARHLFIRH